MNLKQTSRATLRALLALAMALALALPAAISQAATVANIAAAKALWSGSDVTGVTITGPVTVTAALSQIVSNNMFIQDATGAMNIYDNSGTIGTGIVLGDNLTNVTGTISSYSGNLEFLPTAAATVASHNNTVTPLDVTPSSTIDTSNVFKLIRINGITVTATGTWAAGAVNIASPVFSQIPAIYVGTNSGLKGAAIPTGAIDVIGIIRPYGSSYELYPRLATDVSASSAPGADPVLTAPTSVTFDPVALGGSSTTSITLINLGATKALHVDSRTSVTGSGASHFMITGGVPRTIAPGTSATLGLRFDASTILGLTTATLNIHSDNQIAAVNTVKLNGATVRSLPIYEPFNYDAGRLSVLTNNLWNPFSSGGVHPIMTLNANADTANSLAFAGLPVPVGRHAELQGISGESIKLPFANKISSGSVYYSMLIKVVSGTWTGASASTTNSSVVAGLNKRLKSGSEATQGGLRLIQSVTGTPNKYCLGITLNSYTNLDWVNGSSCSTDLDFNTTYLVVVKYTIGSPNDTMKMWINPNPASTTEGQGASQSLTYTTMGTGDNSLAIGDVINGFVLTQQYYAGAFTADVDEVRVSTSYSDVLTVTAPRVNAAKNWNLFE